MICCILIYWLMVLLKAHKMSGTGNFSCIYVCISVNKGALCNLESHAQLGTVYVMLHILFSYWIQKFPNASTPLVLFIYIFIHLYIYYFYFLLLLSVKESIQKIPYCKVAIRGIITLFLLDTKHTIQWDFSFFSYSEDTGLYLLCWQNVSEEWI